MEKSYLIDNISASMRLDAFLAKINPGIPRRFFQTEIESGNILVNKKQTKSSYKLKEGDRIEIGKKTIDKSVHLSVHPGVHKIIPDSKVLFKIIFKNEDFAIVEKPAGLSVHPSQKERAGTLVNGLLEKYPKIKDVGDDPSRPGIVHRLDKDTSGLLIVALNQESFEVFKQMFKDRQIEKNYTAICWGILKKKKGSIESFIGRSCSSPLKQSTSIDPSKVKNPKQALTSYKVLKEFNGMSLVELSPKTGRMHQLRIHLHSIGHPIVGDKKYQTKMVKEKNLKFKRHLLHAQKLRFVFKNKEYEFSSQPPKEFDCT